MREALAALIVDVHHLAFILFLPLNVGQQAFDFCDVPVGIPTITPCLLDIVDIGLVLITCFEIRVPLDILVLVEKHGSRGSLANLEHLLGVRLKNPLPLLGNLLALLWLTVFRDVVLEFGWLVVRLSVRIELHVSFLLLSTEQTCHSHSLQTGR